MPNNPKAADNLRKGGGRPKGIPNKSTIAAKEALQMAFEGIGGVQALTHWAREPDNMGEFFKLYAKLLPIDMKHSGEIVSRVLQVELPKKGK